MIDPGLVGLVSAATALVASFAGPVITLHIGRLQIRASVLSVNRQKWIDSFREAVATFCSQVAASVHLREKFVRDGKVHVSSDAEVIGRFEALIFTLAKIRLLVDPADEDQRKMLALMQEQIDTLRTTAQDADITPRIEATGARIIDASVIILRKEWARVKSLD
jgi:hypothetical protein